MADSIDLHVVVFREADYWLAQGLEHDFGVQGDNLKDLMARLSVLLSAELVDQKLLQLPPSPKYFQDLWLFRAGIFAPGEAFIIGMPRGLNMIFGMVA